jgi:RNA polymerase sigma-70 factor (ECF subfamily)
VDQASQRRDELTYLWSQGAEGLDRFYRDHAGQVLGWAISLSGPRIDPEDVAQEVFAIALKRLHAYRGEGSVDGWLFGITRKVIASNRRRAAWKRLIYSDEPPDTASTAHMADVEVERMRTRRKVQRALGRLKSGHREVLVLVDLQGQSAVEAAELLHVPVGTIYSRLHHARKAFAATLARENIVKKPQRSNRLTVVPPRSRE